MPVTDVSHDFETLHLTIVAEFAAPVPRIWRIYADRHELEKIWGPPSHPATFVQHELVVGARTTYFMTGPEGEKYHGYWIITQVEEPNRFCFDDGFADENFDPDPQLPVSKNDFRFEAIPGGTRVTYDSIYASKEALEQVLAMGVIDGASAAINQIDGFVSA